MATIHHRRRRDVLRLFSERDFPVLTHHFSRQEWRKLVDEDVEAGLKVPGILIGVITTGLIAGIIAVSMIAW